MKKKNFLSLLLGTIALFGISACSDSENIEGEESKGYTYQVELSAGNSFAGESTSQNPSKISTRTLKLDENNNVLSFWAQGDKILIYNLNDNNQSAATSYSMLTAVNGGNKKSDFLGSVVSKNKLQQGHKFAFFYPGDALESDKTVMQVNPDSTKDEDGGYFHIPVSDNKIKSTVSLDMKQQDGTLATIDKKFDYNWGVATLSEVPAEGGKLKFDTNLNRLVTIWGMRFKDADGNIIKNISSVKINNLRSYDVLNMQDGKLIGTEDEKERIINVDIKDRSSLAKDGYVWVAFLADNAETEFTITVYTPTATYTKTAKKVFNKGYDYHSNITMQKVMPQPYVEVNGVLWATGNFIRYVDPNNSSNVYWGIAPAQWWISNYGENPTSANKWNGKTISYDDLGSQHWYIDNHNGQFAQTANDLDLFQWGVIADALNFNDVCYLQGTSYNMEGKYYKGRGGLINVTATTTKSEATHGDIVKYWTEGSNHNYHYQYPTEADFDALVSASTIVPAFCYTDKGNKVYGAYFSDNPIHSAGPKDKFPTGRKLWKYRDVSALVIANKGLFIPIAGRRPIRGANVEYRHVANNSSFTGQYYCSRGRGYSTTPGLMFGSGNAVRVGVPSKDQGASIRPVYVGKKTDDKTKPLDAANFAPFHNILTPAGRLY